MASAPDWPFSAIWGTYDKVSFTAIGAAVNLGANIEPQATPGVPNISEETWRAVRDHFTCRDPAGRTILAKGFDLEEGCRLGM